MTAPLPPDIAALLADLLIPLPDPAHDLLRVKVVAAMRSVWDYHTGLLTDLEHAQADIAALQAQVAALTPTPAPTPPPTPAPDPAPTA